MSKTKIISDRLSFLLQESARCFQDGSSPFSDSFLSQHRVTLTECQTLSSVIGDIILGFASSPTRIQLEIIMQSANAELDSPNDPQKISDSVQYAYDKQKSDELIRKLRDV